MTDAGTFATGAYATCPDTAEQPVALDGGAWLLTPARAARTACLVATCEANGAPADVGPPVPLGIALGLTAALVAGFVLGAVVVGLRR